MVECGNGMFLTTLCVFITVFQILTRETVEGKWIALDVSRIRINPLECYDRTESCTEQAENGYCVSNFNYMIDRCPWSCRFCRRAGGDTKKCTDVSKNCSEWVSKKECTTRPDFMAQNCKKSCEMCGPESDYNVTDTESTCPIWAKAGWCRSNADLLEKCPHSCQKYGVQGASSLDERYITVNFQNTSSETVPEFSEIVAPPPPSAAIRPHSDLDSLTPELKKVLAKEWWDSKLLKLTQKQNEYVTHPELRPVKLQLPRDSNNTAGLGNATHSELGGENATESGTAAGRFQQIQVLPTPAPAPPPRAYNSLLSKLFMSGGPTWTNGTENQAEHPNTNSTAQVNQEVWKDEKEEDEDLGERGQQKGEVPIQENSGDRDLDVEISSSGSGWSNIKGDMIASGENVMTDDDKVEQNTPIVLSSSGSGDVNDEDRNVEGEMISTSEKLASDDDKVEQNTPIVLSSSGSGDVNDEDRNVEGEMIATGEKVASDDDKVEQNTSMVFSSSGSGEVNEDRNVEGEMISTSEKLASDDDNVEQNTSMVFSSSGSGEVNEDRNVEGEMVATGEKVASDDDKVEQNTSMVFSSSGSGEVNEDRNVEGEMTATGEKVASDDDTLEQNKTFSGSGEENQARNHHVVAYSPGSGLAIENVKIVLPENDVSGSGHFGKQETSANFDDR